MAAQTLSFEYATFQPLLIKIMKNKWLGKLPVLWVLT